MEFNVFDFYSRTLQPLTPSDPILKLMGAVMTGAETQDDFTQILFKDTELSHWIRLTVQRMGMDGRVRNLEQMIVLLGQNRVRDLIIGRDIERRLIASENSLLGQLKKNASSKTPATPPPESDIPAPEGEEIIPNLDDFQKYLKCAARAEDVAISCRNSYPNQAFIGGVIFDQIFGFLTKADLSQLTDDRLKKADKFVTHVFESGLRCGLFVNEIIQKISIPNQKSAFVSALLHNIGKILLLLHDPLSYQNSFQKVYGTPDKKKESPGPAAVRIKSHEAEAEDFEIDHAQAASIFLGRMPHLSEIERAIDYHHNPHLLRFSDPALYALSCVLKVSADIEKRYQKSRTNSPDIQTLKDNSVQNTEEFKFLKLDPDEWMLIKSNYVLQLMKNQL